MKTYIENLGLLVSEKLSQAEFEFIAHGYETGATMRENEIALKRLTLPSEKTRCFESVQWGKLCFPIMVAPMAFHFLYNKQCGELAAARACEKTGVPFIVPMISNYSLEAIAQVAPCATLLLQMHVCADLETNLNLIERAREAGYKAIVLTVDVPPLLRKRCDIKNQFSISYSPANFFTNKPIMTERLVWQDVLTIKDYCREMPLYLKGITAVDDALKAYNAGFSGIFISNHGGRINDNTIASIDALLSISMKIIDPNFDIFIDGGFRDGEDVQKALAYGAKAVALGRPCAYALVAGGENALHELLEKFIADWKQVQAMPLEGQVTTMLGSVETKSSETLSARVLFN